MTEWREENLADPSRVAMVAEQARTEFPHLDINQDIEWLSAICADGGTSVLVLSAWQGDRLLGLAPFQVHPSQLQFAFGELTLARKQVRRFALERHPLLSDSLPAEALIECFAALADRLPEDGAVFLRGVPESSTMHALLTERGGPLKALFHVVPHGPSYLRCRIRWDGNFETYLASLGKVTRKDLKRTLKKTQSQIGDFHLTRYTNTDDIHDFYRHAGQVADRTYQSKLLGLGLSQNTGLRAKFSCAASNGAFLGHVLFVDDEPAAFHCGYLHGRRFYMVDGGYDPQWSKAQLGMFTFLQVLQDLERNKDRVDVLDYLYGDGVYKTRTSNMTEPERHYYLMKKGLPGAFLAAAMRASDQLSRGLGRALDQYGIKSMMKRVLRRYAQRHWSIAFIYELLSPAASVVESTAAFV